MEDTIKLTYEISGSDLLQAGEASGLLKLRLKQLGIPQEVIRRVSICMYEGEINMVIHANGGTADVEIGADDIFIWLKDTGPGIPDIVKAMAEGFSTAGKKARDLGFGAGMGLPNMKRCSDEMTVTSTVGHGTTVFMRVHIGKSADVASGRLLHASPATPGYDI
ncbi:MAG: anti-sigma regulatory factor [Oscillospiraceae bacterium]|nr:anti-sigma regulatory factor [Oscillospiraceae bacterium]